MTRMESACSLWRFFNSEGYETYEASNGKLALEIVKQVSPDLVLLDMKIPGMDGLDILKHVKSIDPSIKVIMMTAYGELDMIKEATDLGAYPILRNRSISTNFGQP